MRTWKVPLYIENGIKYSMLNLGDIVQECSLVHWWPVRRSCDCQVTDAHFGIRFIFSPIFSCAAVEFLWLSIELRFFGSWFQRLWLRGCFIWRLRYHFMTDLSDTVHIISEYFNWNRILANFLHLRIILTSFAYVFSGKFVLEWTDSTKMK